MNSLNGDVAITGAGVGGIAAALADARADRRAILTEAFERDRWRAIRAVARADRRAILTEETD